MKWNLVDNLSDKDSVITNSTGNELLNHNKRRAFYLPLASLPPGKSSPELANSALFRIEQGPYEEVSSTDRRVKDVSLNIHMNSPSGGFTNSGDLPDPIIRLHAVSSGTLRFEPVGADKCKLIHTMRPLMIPIKQVKWYDRWHEAGCVPHRLIYENVDRNHFESTIRNLVESIQDENGLYGLKIPRPFIDSDSLKEFFINKFFYSTDPTERSLYALEVDAGAYIGIAAIELSGGNVTTSPRLLKLHATYSSNNADNPNPMNPKELFYLLFGNDSAEVNEHPLLISMDLIGNSQFPSQVPMATKTFMLRPPLRTWARVKWEANKEIGKNVWAGEVPKNGPPQSLTLSRDIYNIFFHRHDQSGWYKCNIFTLDICLRAGFRVPVHKWISQGGSLEPGFRYISPTELAIVASHNSPYGGYGASGEEEPADLKSKDTGQVWGRRWDNILIRDNTGTERTQAERVEKLNKMMEEEGRCFILIRRHNGSAGRGSHRHNTILDSVQVNTGEPNKTFEFVFRQNVSKLMLKHFYCTYYEARPFSASALTGPALFKNYFTSDPNAVILLVELLPGKDPDTRVGCYATIDYNNNTFNLAKRHSSLNVYLGGQSRPALEALYSN